MPFTQIAVLMGVRLAEPSESTSHVVQTVDSRADGIAQYLTPVCATWERVRARD